MSDRREQLMEAFGEASAEVEAPSVEATPEVVPEAPVEAAPVVPDVPAAETKGPARDPSGKFAPKAKVEAPKPEAAAALTPPTTPDVPTPKPAAPTLKPPQSWRPEAREHWAKLPPEVQAEADRLNRETARVLQDSASARKFADLFERTITPYKAFVQGDPLQVVGNLLQTSATLQTGTPQAKAQVAATIIRNFGIDIEALAAALDGNAPAQPQQAAPQEFRDPRFDAFLQQQQQVQQQRIVSEIDAFAQNPANEFFEDVREEMAALISAKPGMTLADAYRKACLLDEGVSKILEQRKKAEAAASAQQRANAATKAASSVRSEPSGPAGKRLSRRELLEERLSASER